MSYNKLKSLVANVEAIKTALQIHIWKIQCKLPPKTKRFCPLVLK